jgi:phosphate starvation-inducible PhoH-like protein
MPKSEILNYESPQFLQKLLTQDLKIVDELENLFGVKLITRDDWIKLEGGQKGVNALKIVLEQLEVLKRQGVEISVAQVRLVAETVKTDLDSKEKMSDDNAAQKLLKFKLLGNGKTQAVLAKTKSQLAYLQAMSAHEVAFGVGPAGTGKTYLAVAQALHCLREKWVQRIVLTRPAVEAGEALGFLPGDLKEKIFPYLRPLYDAIYEMCGADEAERMIERGVIEIAPLAYMRGRTLKNAFIILDEAQNTTCEQMLMFLTRLGEGSRCAITGDPTQTDLKRGMKSGLREALSILKGVEGIAIVEFEATDVVRLPVVQRIIIAYEKMRREAENKTEV